MAMWGERINVCYGISDKEGKYAKVLGTSICSLLENTEAPVTVHIFYDETMSNDNREKFQKMIDNYGQKVCFHDVISNRKDMWEAMKKVLSMYIDFRFTIGAFYRLLMGEILEEESRAIYLDADTIINTDIRELWEWELPESGLAAVGDIVLQELKTRVVAKGLVNQAEYFNSGVLLLDLRKFRSIDHIVRRIAEFIIEHQPEAPDQDFLNFYFPHSAVLPEKFNCFTWRGKEKGEPRDGYIYHYVNHAIALNMEDSFNKLYFKYFVKTPWCDEIFIGNLAQKVNEVNYEYMHFANMCAGKRRIAIGLASGRDLFTENFNLQEGDIYIPLEELENVRLDFKKSRDVFLIFLSDKDYADISSRLCSFGLKEKVHFFNMFSLMGITNKNNINYEFFINC